MTGSSQLTGAIVTAAIAVHQELGPGLLESTYEACLAFELNRRGLKVERQKAMKVLYKALEIDAGYRIDLLVENAVVVEVKAVERVQRIHTAQLLTYLKLSGLHLGLLINFNVPMLKDGLRRVVLNLPEHPLRSQRSLR